MSRRDHMAKPPVRWGITTPRPKPLIGPFFDGPPVNNDQSRATFLDECAVYFDRLAAKSKDDAERCANAQNSENCREIASRLRTHGHWQQCAACGEMQKAGNFAGGVCRECRWERGDLR